MKNFPYYAKIKPEIQKHQGRVRAEIRPRWRAFSEQAARTGKVPENAVKWGIAGHAVFVESEYRYYKNTFRKKDVEAEGEFIAECSLGVKNAGCAGYRILLMSSAVALSIR